MNRIRRESSRKRADAKNKPIIQELPAQNPGDFLAGGKHTKFPAQAAKSFIDKSSRHAPRAVGRVICRSDDLA